MICCLERNVHGYENKLLFGDVKKKKGISKHIYIDYVALFSPVRNERKQLYKFTTDETRSLSTEVAAC